MKKREIKYNTEQVFSPAALDVLRSAVRDIYPGGVRLIESEPGEGVILFGTKGEGIRCLSPAQIATAPHAVTAIKRALMLEKSGPPEIPTDYVVLDTFELFSGGVYNLIHKHDEPWTVDIEYDKNKDMLSLAATRGHKALVFPEEFVQGHYMKVLAEALAGLNFLIGHNWKSDAGVILDHTGVRIPVWFDTMLAHHTLLMAAQGHHDLKSVAETVLGVPDWDTDLHEYTGKGDKADFALAPREMLYEYNALDVIYGHALYEYLLPQVENRNDFWFENHAANMLIDVEYNRLAIDVPYIEKLAVEFEEEMQAQLALLPDGLNPNSPKQLKEYFHSEGLKLTNTAKDTLEKHADHPAVAPILTYRGAAKNKSTYGDAYLRAHENGLLRANWNVHGTSTGRLSSSKPFNAQNIPRDPKIKRIFVAKGEDRRCVSADYSQADLRSAAGLSQDPDMIALFQPDSPDFFNALMPVAYAEQFKDIEAFEEYKKTHPEDAGEMRTVLKSVVYGLMYGRQAGATAQALGISVPEAQKIINDFLNGFPVFRDWRYRVSDAAIFEDDRDMLVTPLGRKFNQEVVTNRNKQSVINAALAFLPQSTASDLTLLAAIEANNILRSEGWDAEIVSLIHDEIVADSAEDIAEDTMHLLQECMQKAGRTVFGDQLVFSTSGDIGNHWGEI